MKLQVQNFNFNLNATDSIKTTTPLVAPVGDIFIKQDFNK